eukprot:1179124-Prorocentrum_minimum.AAC.1
MHRLQSVVREAPYESESEGVDTDDGRAGRWLEPVRQAKDPQYKSSSGSGAEKRKANEGRWERWWLDFCNRSARSPPRESRARDASPRERRSGESRERSYSPPHRSSHGSRRSRDSISPDRSSRPTPNTAQSLPLQSSAPRELEFVLQNKTYLVVADNVDSMIPMIIPHDCTYSTLKDLTHAQLKLDASQALYFKFQGTLCGRPQVFEIIGEESWNAIKRRIASCDDILEVYGEFCAYNKSSDTTRAFVTPSTTCSSNRKRIVLRLQYLPDLCVHTYVLAQLGFLHEHEQFSWR